MDIILKPFAWLLLAFYNLTHSYALALVLFTLVIKVVLFPLSIKGKRSMMKTTSLQGKMKQLEKQYGKDKQRYQEELQKLYEKEKVNPMGGCLWSLIPFPILIGLYGIIRQPLYYLAGLTVDQVNTVIKAVEGAGAVFKGNSGYEEIFVADLLNQPQYMDAARTALGEAGSKLFTMDFHFLGINLAGVPNWKIWEGPFDWPTIGLFLIPVFVTLLNVLSSRVSMKTNSFNKNESNPAADATSKQMMIIMPLTYLWFGYIMPGGMCIYMAANAVFMMLQDLLCARILRKEYAEMAAKREEQERLEKEEEKRLKEERRLKRLQEAEELKKSKGKKKPVKLEKKKGPTNEAGRIGLRAYARGRSYDPDRFGGVTPYQDPDHPVDEEAMEAALKAKAAKAEEAQAMEDEDLLEVPEESAGSEESDGMEESEALEEAEDLEEDESEDEDIEE
ncbi:MAG: membrane protein insertase YidC [Oscillospiraceae bacterium]|nr:membrane protein insertase YidC [Oscillospiraceae bacterium]